MADDSVAHPARRYNYWLGGKDNFAADRASADEFERAVPGVRDAARANRAVLRRAVRILAAEYGVRQFLDIGTGLPTADNTHEVAQRVDPASRIVYVDNDPLVLTHARALLTSTPEGRTAYLEADVNDPRSILDSAEVRDTLDLSRPVALILVSVLHFIPYEGKAAPVVRELLEALAPGSFMMVTHATTDFAAPEDAATLKRMFAERRSDIYTRDRAEISTLFDGLEILPPGVVANTQWRPDPSDPQIPLSVVAGYTGVARKR